MMVISSREIIRYFTENTDSTYFQAAKHFNVDGNKLRKALNENGNGIKAIKQAIKDGNTLIIQDISVEENSSKQKKQKEEQPTKNLIEHPVQATRKKGEYQACRQNWYALLICIADEEMSISEAITLMDLQVNRTRGNKTETYLNPEELLALYEGGKTYRQIANLFGVAQSTVINKIKQYKKIKCIL